MPAKSYAFKLGHVNCTVLLDGTPFIGACGILKRFPEATEAEYRLAYTDIGLKLDEATDSFNILVAQLGEERVLVDAGEGGRPHGGHLLDSMRLAGIAPDSITQVVITHAHGDHILGLVSDDHEPLFPNATYVISRDEMAYWQSRMDGGMADQSGIVAMMRAKGLRLIDMDEEIMSGLAAVPIPGHTPGQIALLFESQSEKLLHMADLLHNPMQFAHPEWSPTFDVDIRCSVPTRRNALDQAASENLLTLFYHLTFPGLGWVRQAETGFRWQPLGMA